MADWNPWHGCKKISPGCMHCYVYRTDAKYGRDSSQVARTSSFSLPIARNRQGAYKVQGPDVVYTCFTSDFLLKDADPWRPQAWDMMRVRDDLHFLFITKRIHRLAECLPPDWGEGYENVTICCTVENQDRADFRLPIFLAAPIRHKQIVCEPLLEPIDLTRFLTPAVEQVLAGGESGAEARVCDYDWVLSLRAQCVEAGVPFHFKQTGARFRKNGRLYAIERRLQHDQARRAGIDYHPPPRGAQTDGTI